MKTKVLTILLSINLLLLGCSNKSAQINTPAQKVHTTSDDTKDTSTGEKVLMGTLIIGATGLLLTTAAVVILLLVPKAQTR